MREDDGEVREDGEYDEDSREDDPEDGVLDEDLLLLDLSAHDHKGKKGTEDEQDSEIDGKHVTPTGGIGTSGWRGTFGSCT